MRERGEVGDAGVGDDQRRPVAVDEPRERVRDRRQAAAAVDQDRHLPIGRQLEDRREPLVVEQEALRARVQLDAAGAEVEAARRLLDRPLGEVEPHERHQRPPLAGAHASVRSLAARKAGCRSGSSRQNTIEREMPARSCTRSSSSESPTMPSMSWPRCVWTSTMSHPSGSSARRAPRSGRRATRTLQDVVHRPESTSREDRAPLARPGPRPAVEGLT